MTLLRSGCIIDFVDETSVRKVDAVPAVVGRAEQIADLRAKIAQIGGGVPGQVGQPVVADVDVLGMGEQFRFLLPGGGLPRRAVTHMSDCPALIVEMLLAVTAAGGHAGVVGWPELSYAALPPESLERIIAVPDPGADPPGITAVLCEGLDMVVYRSPAPLALSPVRSRPLLGKLRTGRAALMLVGATVPSPALAVTGRVEQFRGIGQGTGRITGLDIRVRAQGKGAQPMSGTVTVGAAAPPSPVLKAVP